MFAAIQIDSISVAPLSIVRATDYGYSVGTSCYWTAIQRIWLCMNSFPLHIEFQCHRVSDCLFMMASFQLHAHYVFVTDDDDGGLDNCRLRLMTPPVPC